LPPSKYASAPPANAAYRGTLTHRVLQHLSFAAAASGVRQELGRLVEQHVISPEDQALIDIEGLTWFLSTPLADRIRRAGSAYRREFRFIAMEPLEEIDPTLVGECQDHVLVRGIVDGVLAAPEGLTLIDFKTDAIAAAQVAERAAGYEPQLRLYARAALKLWRRPIRECLLVFLTPRQVVSLNPGAPGSSC
jgi:ATP-dependent helicase/nuclease subunit A